MLEAKVREMNKDSMESPGSSTVQVGGGELGVVKEQTKQFLLRSVTSNSLISDHIFSYLSLGDLKAASLVSRDFFQIVRTSRQFNSSAVLLLTENNAQEIINICETRGKLPMRGIRIDVAVPSIILLDIHSILEQVTFLSFITLPRNEKLPRGSVSKIIHHVLASTSKLIHLQIDVRLMHRKLYEAFSCPAVQSILKKLKGLEILFQQDKQKLFECSSSLNNAHTFEYNFDRSAPWLLDNDAIGESSEHEHIFYVDSDDRIFSKNFLILAELLTFLETLHVTKVKSNSFLKPILLLLQNNQETLRDLSVHLNVWSCRKLRTLVFPRLKRLTGTIDSRDQYIVKSFLSNNLTTSVEELDIAVVSGQFDRSLLQIISNCCAGLRKFHLRAKQFHRGGNVDWSFLGGMKRLEDFYIARPLSNASSEVNEHAFGTGPRFLEYLPRNQLQRLRFKGIEEKSSFWRTKIGTVYMEPDFLFKLDLLSGFSNIKCLSFYRCGNAVDDQVIQFIFKKMLQMEKFEISHCPGLTDAGIAGTIPGKCDSVLILNLKRLKFLNIRSCPSVTPEGILACVRLPSLKRFDYLTKDNVHESFVVQLACQNPNLEVLSLNLTSEDSKKEDPLCTKSILRGISNPRLRTLIDLGNKNNCQHLNRRFFMERRSSNDPDSDSDADYPM